ncbi:hypothetical protein GOP47_0010472 [Adiantum capillus-veneris]|uniref:Crossover junction endonuclease MUS81 n=1 Tax=Adiantum capillus-veneris TaxID=13818 RepID=A0A9D4UV26_ADICA|nr:hypothetical protein GOP47_0010472 [Adiantum capillus-veneris]
MERAHARCVENEPLAVYILEQRQALAAKEGYSENLDATLSKAYRNVCECDHPICSLRDASQIQGIGQWVLKMLKGFFSEPVHSSQETIDKATGKKKANRRYVPQKSSAPYAILLTLHKAMQEGRDYMKKQELIDAADASGLSRMSIQPSKCAGPSAQFGYSTKDWYSGWSSMKTLVTKGLVVKSSCPAKYKLTEEGISTAEECLQRSGVQTKTANSSINGCIKTCSSAFPPAMVDGQSKTSHVEEYTDLSAEEDLASHPSKHKRREERSTSADDRAQCHGLQIRKCSNASNSSRSTPFPSLLVAERSKVMSLEECTDLTSDSDEAEDAVQTDLVKPGQLTKSFGSEYFTNAASDKLGALNVDNGDRSSASSWLHLPPLLDKEKFLETYAVVLILDDRERFMNTGKGNTLEKFAEQIKLQFQIKVEIRRLPVGDTLWLARHRVTREEYVLDFIVERKNVSDLLLSIRDTRYKQQKLRLMRCGLRKLIYVVEGDPNVMDSSESIKTACFTTEIAEGFDVQRTRDVRDTLRKYGHLTHAISAYYNELSGCKHPRQGLCKTYRQFVDDCKDLDREKVSDVFGVMLMQIRQVTESIALTILEKYPTPFSLVTAYSNLKGDEKAKENLLKGLPIINQSKEISSTVSKRVFQFFCSPNMK